MIGNLLKTTTLRQSAITITGTIVNGVIGILFYVLVARVLGPANFGLVTIAIATLTMISDIADLGTNTGLIRYVSAHIENNRRIALQYLKLSLFIKLIVGGVVVIAGLILAPVISNLVFQKPELTPLLRLAMLGVLGALLFTFASSSLQALQRFTTWSLLNITSNLIRLLVVLLIAYLGFLNPSNTLATYIALPFFGFFVSLLILPVKEFTSVNIERSIGTKLFEYNSWVAMFVVLAAISSRMDTFLNGRLLTIGDVGIYGAANQLAGVMPQIVGALGTVVAPKFAGFQSLQQMLAYFKKLQLFVIGLSVLGLILMPFVIKLIPSIFGHSYTPSVPVFIVLFVGMIIFLISVPVHNSIIFYYSNPKFFVWLALGHLILVSALGYYLISNYGVMGAATTVLIGNLFNFLVPVGYFIRRVSK